MSGTRYNPEKAAVRRNNEFLGDMAAWDRANGEDNSEQMERLRRNLKKVRRAELTPRQAEMVHLYYDLGMTMPQIAAQLGVTKSSVSRTRARGRKRLKRYLQYSF